MRTLILAASITFAVADITPVQEEVTIKEKLMEMLQQHDTAVSFDASVTDEIARSIYNKYRTANNNNNKKGIKVGERRPFPNKQGSNINRKLLLDDDGWDNTDKQSVLDLHNEYRSDVASGNQEDDGTDGTYPTASNMNKLFWDDALASVAQAYSDTCVWGHNGDRNDEFYDYEDLARFDYPSSDIYLGENIAIYYTSSDTILDSYLTERVDDWWSEYDLWHYQTYASDAYDAGHFTQMAWADTRYLGCGFSYCHDDSWYTYYLVCNYYPGGNYLNQYPYDEGTCSSTTCDGDRTTTCDDSLCAGCMDPSFVETGSTSDNTDCDGSVDGADASDSDGSDSDGSDSGNESGGTYSSTADISNTDDSGVSPGSSSGAFSLANSKQIWLIATVVVITISLMQ